jgi:hypothetical protein
MAFSIFGMIATQLMWDENKPNAESTTSFGTSFNDALKELKKRDVLSIGIIESLYQAVLNIYLFAWTPILQSSTDKGINVGFIFTCFVITMILGTTFYEIFMIYLRCPYYLSISLALLLEVIFFLLVAYVDQFLTRLIFLALINGITGFYNPLNSIIKSRILVEQHRALLMSIFRIPLNGYVIIVLVCIRYMGPFEVFIIITNRFL